MTTSIVQQDVAQMLDRWIEAEQSGDQFPVPFDTHPEEGFFFSLLALSEINELSRGIHWVDKSACIRLRSKIGEIEKWRRKFAMPSAAHHDILIEMCDATRLSIYHAPKSLSKSESGGGHVYFLMDREVGTVKIGWSTDYAGRIKSISGGHARPLKLLKLVRAKNSKKETEFHRQFKEYRLNGEWFRVEGKLKKFLQADIDRSTATIREDEDLKAEYLPALDNLLGRVDRQQWIGE
jgi:hypothetical protein